MPGFLCEEKDVSTISQSFEFPAVSWAAGVLTECSIRFEELAALTSTLGFIVAVVLDHNIIGELPSALQCIFVRQLPKKPAPWLIQEPHVLLPFADGESVYTDIANNKDVRRCWMPMDPNHVAFRPLLFPSSVVKLFQSVMNYTGGCTSASPRLVRIAAEFPFDDVYKCHRTLEDAIILCSSSWTWPTSHPSEDSLGIFEDSAEDSTHTITISKFVDLLILQATEELVHVTEQITGNFPKENVTAALSKLGEVLSVRVKELSAPIITTTSVEDVFVWLGEAFGVLSVQNTLHEIVRDTYKDKSVVVASVPAYVRGVELLRDGLRWYDRSVEPIILNQITEMYNAFIAVSDKPVDMDDDRLHSLGKATRLRSIDATRTAIFVQQPSASAAVTLTDMNFGILLDTSSFSGVCYMYCNLIFEGDSATSDKFERAICSELAWPKRL